MGRIADCNLPTPYPTVIAKLCYDMAILTVLMLTFMTGMRDLHDEDGS